MGAEDILLMMDFLRDFSKLDFREPATMNEMLAQSRHMDMPTIKEILTTTVTVDQKEKLERIKRWIRKKIEKEYGDYHETQGNYDWTVFSPKERGIFANLTGHLELKVRTVYERLEHYARRIITYTPGNEKNSPNTHQTQSTAELARLLEQQLNEHATFPQVIQTLQTLPLKQKSERFSVHYEGTMPLTIRRKIPIQIVLTVTDGIPEGRYKHIDIGQKVQLELFAKCDKPDSHYRLA